MNLSNKCLRWKNHMEVLMLKHPLLTFFVCAFLLVVFSPYFLVRRFRKDK